MAPPNDPASPPLSIRKHDDSSDKCFDLSNGKFSVKGFPLLSEVPSNVTFAPLFSSICEPHDAPLALLQRVQALSHKGGFLGFHKEAPSDRLINSLGKLTGREFLSIFRFKTWWSTMWVGNSGSDLQMETQWVLLNVPEIRSYVIIIPVIDGSFRSALHPGTDGHVMICVESGSTKVTASSFDAIAYVHVSENPYHIMNEAYSALRLYLNTFKLLEEKAAPSLIDKFGWCTWDAFYLTVEPAGVWHGVNDFVEGGVSPRFLIIDDGWQSINFDGENPNEDAKNLVLGGPQMTARLHRLDECEKFREYKGGSMLGPHPPSFDPKKPKMLISKAIELEHAEKDRDKAIQSGVTDLSAFESKIQKLKQELDVMFCGDEKSVSTGSSGSCSCKADSYGVRPGATHLNSKIIPCKLSGGLDGTMNDLAVVKIIEGGIGLVQPDQGGDFYDSMHSYLASVGVTGAKVDAIHTLEYVSEEYGGRVELAKSYHRGLSDSLAGNVKGSGLISSMQQCNDFFFLGTKHMSMGGVGDDFWLQGVHMIHCAYDSMWMGQIIQPDWDIFQSDHLCSRFHAGSRAICGGPVYVSDSVGGHDFELLKKLVYPDGVIGAFNCQGAGWDPQEKRSKGFVPVKKLGNSIKFAPIGLTNMFNSGGAIQELEYFDSEAETCVKIEDQNPSRIKALNVINEDIKDEDSVILNLELINVFRRITNADACSFVCEHSLLVSFKAKVQGNEEMVHYKSNETLWEKVMEGKARRRCPPRKHKHGRHAEGKRPRRVLMKRVARVEGSTRRAGYGVGRRVRTLKKLIPNGESLGLDGLFRETADYILSLQTRVKVMQLMVKELTGSDE
ncbi:hypothetical protein POTOM_046843 [Populus tomentosa]|uniref:Stachyose synthase n=1 Tax=Populus tomentosa TaxID=118781 RepID=A0A8X7YF51_POPTO|nr:hypothetical protein POTOM_046843 [Populus tomentosa]